MHQILQIFKNKMTLIAYVVSKFQTVKVMVRQMSKSPNFMAHFYGQHVKGSQALVKCPSEYFSQFILSLYEKLTWKASVLVIFEPLRLFVKTLTADDKYSVCNIWNLSQDFVKEDDSHSLCSFQVVDCESYG